MRSMRGMSRLNFAEVEKHLKTRRLTLRGVVIFLFAALGVATSVHVGVFSSLARADRQARRRSDDSDVIEISHPFLHNHSTCQNGNCECSQQQISTQYNTIRG